MNNFSKLISNNNDDDDYFGKENTKEGYLNFKAIDANLLMEDFENFSTENLGKHVLFDLMIQTFNL